MARFGRGSTTVGWSSYEIDQSKSAPDVVISMVWKPLGWTYSEYNLAARDPSGEKSVWDARSSGGSGEAEKEASMVGKGWVGVGGKGGFSIAPWLGLAV